MKVISHTDTAGQRTTTGGAQEKPKTRFSDVLENRKQRHQAEDVGCDGDQKVNESKKETDRERPPAVEASPLLVAIPPTLVSMSQTIAPVDVKREVAAPDLGPVLGALVQEIRVHTPPGGVTSVEIQFNSRTLDGLQVRVQKTREGLDVRLSTSSDAVSRLLAQNTEQLASALVKQGYSTPVISIERPVTTVGTTPVKSGRDRDGRRGSGEQGQGRNRR